MVDYNIAIPQQQLFQAPDMMQNAMRMQQLQAQNMQMQQSQRTQQQQNALAELMGSGIDMNSPEFRQKAFAVGGLSAVPYAQAAAAMRKEDTASRAEEARAGRYRSQSQASDFELGINKRKEMLNRAPGAMVSEETWAKYVDDSVKEFGPGISLPRTRPSEKDLIAFLSSASDKIRQVEAETKAAQEAGQFTVQTSPAGLIKVNKLGQFGMATELPRDGAPVAGAAAPAVGNAPVARAAAPVAGGEAGYLTGLNRAEGTTKNPYSSADGKFQFIDSTFVDTARKTFPGLANNSPAEILRLRGVKLGDGRQIEDLLEQTLRADNTQALTSAGIAPTPGNTYLAHFLGAGGARSLLSVDPNTPVSQILDPRAIAANKSVLEGKTAGQVAAWADSKFGGAPGLAASMTAGNQRQGGVGAPSFTPAMGGGMSPTAPTMNNAMALGLMGQQPPQQGNALAMQAAPMLQQQPVPVTTAPAQTAPAPSTYEEALRAADERAMEKLRQTKIMETEVNREATNKDRREAARQALLIVADPGIPDLIKKSTAGLGQLAKGAVYTAATGGSTTGDIQSGKLDMITNKIALDLAGGKLGGGFSNEDREFTLKIVGNMGNKNLGIDQRLAAYEQLKELLSSIAENRAMKIVPGAVEESKPSARRRTTLDGVGGGQARGNAAVNGVDTSNPLLR